jgi:hypothetical protein
MFYAETFIFNDTPCEFYNLKLGEVNGSGEAVTVGASDVTLLTQKLFRRPVPLFYGPEQTPVLQFGLSIMSPDEITAESYSEISTWLYAQMNYKELRICEPDMQETWFDCFLTAPQIVRVGNIIRGTTCTVTCSAPWGYRPSQILTYNYTSETISETEEIFNDTANSFYTYPTSLIITANSFGGTATITNTTDSYRESNFTFSANEILTLNCDLQTIASSLNTYPLSQFTDKHWLRLLPKYNLLTFEGNIKSIQMTLPRATKIGG